MSVQEMNMNILAALQTAIDLPSRIRSLDISIGVDKVPELTITRILCSTDPDNKSEVLTVTKRYGLSEIKSAEEIDVTTMCSTAKEFKIGRRG